MTDALQEVEAALRRFRKLALDVAGGLAPFANPIEQASVVARAEKAIEVIAALRSPPAPPPSAWWALAEDARRHVLGIFEEQVEFLEPTYADHIRAAIAALSTPHNAVHVDRHQDARAVVERLVKVVDTHHAGCGNVDRLPCPALTGDAPCDCGLDERRAALATGRAFLDGAGGGGRRG